MADAESTLGEGVTVLSSRLSRWAKIKEGLSLVTRSKTALVGLSMVLFWVIIAMFADNCIVSPACWTNPGEFEGTPWLARYSPFEQFSGDNLQGPSQKHWLGTDRLGRDLWARLAYGGRTILTLSPLSVLLSLLVGSTLGSIAGYKGGMTDEVIMRLLDAWMAFPTMLIYLVIIAALGASAFNVVLALGVGGTPAIARMVRGLTLDIKTRDYVRAAQTRGERTSYIILVEILPNARGPILVDAMLRVGYAAFGIGALGFLGLGLPPPRPDWGTMVAQGRNFLLAGYHPWMAIWGCLAVAMVVVGLNLAADGINQELNRYQ